MTALENVPVAADRSGSELVADVRADGGKDSALHSTSARVLPLDPVRYLDNQVEVVMPALLAASPAPQTVDELVRAWRGRDEVVDRSVPPGAVPDAIASWARRSAVVLDDGRIGLVERPTLPQPRPWADAGMPFAVDADPLSRGVSGWPGDWGHLVGAVAAAVRPAQFRSMHVEAADRFGGACVIDVAVVDLGQTVAALTTSQLVCSRRSVASLERGHWWFWDAATTTPLLDPQARLYGAEILEGQLTRCVHAAASPRGVGEAVALLLLAANLDRHITLTVSIDGGPETLCGRSAEEWARTPADAGVMRCLECGRPLTEAESAGRGYGPGCWERLGTEAQGELERLVLPLRWRGGSGWAYPLPVGAFDSVVARA